MSQIDVKEPGINKILDIVFEASIILGKRIFKRLSDMGRLVMYFYEVLRKMFTPPFRLSQIFTQLEFIGNQSLTIILLSGFFTGAVFGLQIGAVFGIFKSESLIGAATSEALARELGPLMTGFLLAGRGGSAITAEISSMKVNEQIDAMEAMAVDPVHYLVVPRVIASLFMVPILCGLFILVGAFGSWLIAVNIYEVDTGTFMERILWMVQPKDILSGMFKAFVFAFIISAVSCRFGLGASGGAKGVGVATTESVIASLLLILLSDVIITILQVVIL